MMKIRATTFLALSVLVSSVEGQTNVAFRTFWEDWQWCCADALDANPPYTTMCPDACARVSGGPGDPWYDEYGPESALYAQQQAGTFPPDLTFDQFSNVGDFVTNKCIMMHGFCCNRAPRVCGDPHFITWSGEHFEYQGQCELKLISAPDFGGPHVKNGLDIHIRTKIRYAYSFIESAAIRIGNDVLEVGSWGEYWLNGVEHAELPALMSGFPVSHFERSEKEHIFEIFLGDDRRILIKTLKDWVSVSFDSPAHEDFATSVGLLGNFKDGRKLARDGQTVLLDDNEFGQEWQVQPDEPQLFQRVDFVPLHPNECILPKEELLEQTQRRLAEAGITKEEAEAACAHLPRHNEFCVKDVLATGDLELAQGSY